MLHSKKIIVCLLFEIFLPKISLQAQSMELMPGTKRVFMDIQWLKSFDKQGKWSLFSRTRGSVDYKEETSLFTGVYFEYNTSSGFGPTILGRISDNIPGTEVGIHYVKRQGYISIYSLSSIQLSNELSYSLFSIIRYRPEISKKLHLYTSFEFFSSFDKIGHVVSVQRIRAGLSKNSYQFGLGLNLSELGSDFSTIDTNFGIFIRNEF